MFVNIKKDETNKVYLVIPPNSSFPTFVTIFQMPVSQQLILLCLLSYQYWYKSVVLKKILVVYWDQFSYNHRTFFPPYSPCELYGLDIYPWNYAVVALHGIEGKSFSAIIC